MEEIKQKLEKLVEKLFDIKVDVNVVAAPENTGADYASNIAMQLAKLVHKSPMVVAEMLKAGWEDSLSERSTSSEPAAASSQDPKSSSVRRPVLSRTSSKITSPSGLEKTGEMTVEVAAPGFINFTLNSEVMIERARSFANDLQSKIAVKSYQGKEVVAEFSDPNPFKVLHVGHLYTSVVGDSISRLLEFAGAKVIRANFGGDVGLHVAKTLYALGESLLADTSVSTDALLVHRTESTAHSVTPVSLNSLATNELPEFNAWLKEKMSIEMVAKCYVEGTRAYEEDETAKAEITKLNKEIYRINAEDVHGEALADLYWRGRELSYQYFDDFYERIGVKFDKYYPESTVAERGLQEVKAHTGTTYEESDGAIVYKGEKVGLHTRVFINREGVPTYEAKDVGLIFTKWDDWHFDESIVVTGNEQSDYMKVVLASVSEYAPKLVEHTTHLTHGLVKLPGNVKMSSRKGNFLKAVDVIEIIQDNLNSDEQQKPENEDVLVLAAIKYAFLKYKMGGDIVFDPQESVSTTGNSGIYLLYSAVRAKKILQKRGGKIADGEAENLAEERNYEKNLSKEIVCYSDVLQEAVREKAPYKICNYLYTLAQEFSRFYEHVKVAGNVRENELMQLVKAYLNVMEHGLGLLGINVPESM